MTRFAVKLPDREDEIAADTPGDVARILEDYRARNPDTLFAQVYVHEHIEGATVGAERSVYDFIN